MNNPAKILIVSAIIALLGVGVWYGLEKPANENRRLPELNLQPLDATLIDVLDFFAPEGSSTRSVTSTSGFQFALPVGFHMCEYNFTTTIKLDSVSCNDSAGSMLSIYPMWGPGEQRDSNLVPLKAAFGDSLIYLWDKFPNVPSERFTRIEGNVGSVSVYGLRYEDSLQLVARQGEKTISIATDTYEGLFRQVLGTLVRSLKFTSA